jgi:hypothetical protein
MSEHKKDADTVYHKKDADTVYVDESLQGHLEQLGAYNRTVRADGTIRIQVYRDEAGELRIRIGRWLAADGEGQ